MTCSGRKTGQPAEKLRALAFVPGVGQQETLPIACVGSVIIAVVAPGIFALLLQRLSGIQRLQYGVTGVKDLLTIAGVAQILKHSG